MPSIDDIIAEALGTKTTLKPHTSLAVLDSSSISKTLLCMKLEEELGIAEITNEEMRAMQTVADVHELVAAKRGLSSKTPMNFSLAA